MATRGDAASRVASAASGGRTGRARGAGFGASTRSLISSTSFWISSSSSAVAGVVVSAWRTRSKVEPRNARYPAAGWMESESPGTRSEEHTSELQSRLHLVCRLLLEKKKKKTGQADPR